MSEKILQKLSEVLSNAISNSNKKKTGAEPVLEIPVSDFIPYACHWNEDTLLTKNGELMQVIKITGFSSEAIGSEKLDLREVIREAISQVRSDDFAFWIHTVRRLKNLDPGGEFPIGFSDDLNHAWKEEHGWNRTYVNEVYITIIKTGNSVKLANKAVFIRSLFFVFLKKSQNEYLDGTLKELYEFVDKMLGVLEPFGAKRLRIYESRGVFYSEILQFLAKILNLSEFPVKVPINDIPFSINNSGIAVGFNTMEIRGRRGKKFGAMFSLKEYYELPGETIDDFLQLPQEFIITQTLDFIRGRVALKEFSHQRLLLNVSKDDELAKLTGLDAIVKSDRKNDTDFGESQITILVFNDTINGLQEDITDMSDALTSLGILAPRRDLRLEECFWAQLPANFSYVQRQKPIATRLVGGFASLFNYPAGKRFGNYWGPAVTMFRTVHHTPFFFNFHVDDNGHTAIIGPRGMGKTVMTNFMVSEARKFNGRIFFFDQEDESKVFIKAIGGYYTHIDPSKASAEYAFNPLYIPDTPENRAFLKEWLAILAKAGTDYINEEKREKKDRVLLKPVSQEEKIHFGRIVDAVYKLPEEKRRLSTIAPYFKELSDLGLEEKMSIWHGEGKYAHLFDNDINNLVDLSGKIYGFAVCDVVEDEITLGPVMSYLFHRIEMLLDGIPTIIVLDEAWTLVNNDIFAPKLENWLNRLRNKNAIVIFATEAVPDDQNDSVTNTIANSIATKIFLPNPDASDFYRAYKNVWELSESEYEVVSKIRGEKRQFMLKQAKEPSIVVNLDLSGLKEVKILSGDDKTVIMMEDAIKERGEDPKEWLPAVYEKLESRY